jgi:hypothetical protein
MPIRHWLLGLAVSLSTTYCLAEGPLSEPLLGAAEPIGAILVSATPENSNLQLLVFPSITISIGDSALGLPVLLSSLDSSEIERTTGDSTKSCSCPSLQGPSIACPSVQIQAIHSVAPSCCATPVAKRAESHWKNGIAVEAGAIGQIITTAQSGNRHATVSAQLQNLQPTAVTGSLTKGISAIVIRSELTPVPSPTLVNPRVYSHDSNVSPTIAAEGRLPVITKVSVQNVDSDNSSVVPAQYQISNPK